MGWGGGDLHVLLSRELYPKCGVQNVVFKKSE